MFWYTEKWHSFIFYNNCVHVHICTLKTQAINCFKTLIVLYSEVGPGRLCSKYCLLFYSFIPTNYVWPYIMLLKLPIMLQCCLPLTLTLTTQLKIFHCRQNYSFIFSYIANKTQMNTWKVNLTLCVRIIPLLDSITPSHALPRLAPKI